MRRRHEITPVSNHQTGLKQAVGDKKGNQDIRITVQVEGTTMAHKRKLGMVKKPQLYRAATSDGKYK